MNLLSNFGGLGDCLFFGISAWFLSEEIHGLGKNVKRVCTLEAQLFSMGQSYLRQRWRLNAQKEVLSRWAVCATLCLVLSFP